MLHKLGPRPRPSMRTTLRRESEFDEPLLGSSLVGRTDLSIAPGAGCSNIESAGASQIEIGVPACGPSSEAEPERVGLQAGSTGPGARNLSFVPGTSTPEDPVRPEDIPTVAATLAPDALSTGREPSERIASMAAGVGGFNIDPPPSRPNRINDGILSADTLLPPSEPCSLAPPTNSSTEQDVVEAKQTGDRTVERMPPRIPRTEANIILKNMRGRWLFDVDHPPRSRWIGKLSLFFSLSAVVGLSTALLVLPDEAPRVAGTAAKISQLSDNPSLSRPPILPTHLVVQNRYGSVNEPIPLGVSLAEASGGESLTVVGLITGSKLSAGTPLGVIGWQLSARDLDKVVVYPPTDFIGVMDVVADLRSAHGQPLDLQLIRLEWTKKEDARLTFEHDRVTRPVRTKPLGPAEIDTLTKRAEEFIAMGEIASAQVLLRRAADAGHAQAALALGMTFDPAFLAKKGVVGFAPDVIQALTWYDKAKSLGSTEASRHFERLVGEIMPR
jgi:hypothetical protein